MHAQQRGGTCTAYQEARVAHAASGHATASGAAQSFVGTRIPLAGVAHQNGTVRFGNDPATSALDVNCRANDVDNLHASSTAASSLERHPVNPALTIMANALRVGDHIRRASRRTRAAASIGVAQ